MSKVKKPQALGLLNFISLRHKNLKHNQYVGIKPILDNLKIKQFYITKLLLLDSRV